MGGEVTIIGLVVAQTHLPIVVMALMETNDGDRAHISLIVEPYKSSIWLRSDLHWISLYF